MTKTLRRREKRLIEIAKALKGQVPKDELGHYFHATFILSKRKIIVIGTNDYKREHPANLFGVYTNAKSTGIYRPGIHSEIDALKKLGRIDTKGLELWNICITPSGNIGCSRPCNNCSKVLSKMHFKRIFYHDVNKNLRLDYEI